MVRWRYEEEIHDERHCRGVRRFRRDRLLCSERCAESVDQRGNKKADPAYCQHGWLCVQCQRQSLGDRKDTAPRCLCPALRQRHRKAETAPSLGGGGRKGWLSFASAHREMPDPAGDQCGRGIRHRHYRGGILRLGRQFLRTAALFGRADGRRPVLLRLL